MASELTNASDADRPEDLTTLLEEVRRIEAQSSHLVSGIMAGGYRSVFRGSGIEFEEIREYVDGDDPRAVDWNVTARVGRPFVKEYVEERELTMLFLLDLSASMTAGFGAWSSRQAAARVCACLALAAVRNDDKVGLVGFGNTIERFVPPRKGVRHALRIVRDCLALPTATGTATNLSGALEFASRAMRRHAVVFVVSDFLGDPSAWERELALCSRHHDVIAVRLLSPELQPPSRGMWRVRDPETGATEVVDWGHAPTRVAYEERVAQWRRRIDGTLRQARVDTIDVPIPAEPDRDAIAGPILSFYRMRERRGSRHR